MSDYSFTPPGETSQAEYDREEIRKLRAQVAKLKTQVPTITKYYTCHAMCLNQVNEECVKSLGIVRGMSDNGREGWSDYAEIQFTSIEEARAMLKTPGAFSSYHAEYKGGKTWIKETVEITTKVLLTQDLEA